LFDSEDHISLWRLIVQRKGNVCDIKFNNRLNSNKEKGIFTKQELFDILKQVQIKYQE